MYMHNKKMGKDPMESPWCPGNAASVLSWDFTCQDTLASSYRAVALSAPGSVAAQAEMKKIAKYSSLQCMYSFMPVAIIGHIWCKDS